jgi:YD repeat-containing protein
VNNGAYTCYIYGPNYVQSFATVNNIADEAYSIQVFDGVGRVRATAGNHPGSAGGYGAQDMIYDLMGRQVKQSNPTEINGSWVPAGDDAAGWLYRQQSYNWQGRPLITTNTDGTTKEASYSGCGCAGGEAVTLTDEVGRRQKVYSDVLGRNSKTEILNWDGSVYSTTINIFNARDQVTLVRQFQGTEGGGLYQDTTMTYDGYGRLQTRHVPEQNAGTATVYVYNADDTVQSVTDARGATCIYSYNGRHQITSATHTLSGQSTNALTYGYDAAGNRTSMTDSVGSTSYNYNQLSRMTSETRTFNGLGVVHTYLWA